MYKGLVDPSSVDFDTGFTIAVYIPGINTEIVNNYYIEVEHIYNNGNEIIYDYTVGATEVDDFLNIVEGTAISIREANRDLSTTIDDVYGVPITGSPLADGEEIKISEINSDFDGYYRLIANDSYDTDSQYIKTDRAATVAYPQGYTKEMPIYTAETYTTTILLPGFLKTEPTTEYRFVFDHEGDDIFLNSMQILTVQDSDIDIELERV